MNKVKFCIKRFISATVILCIIAGTLIGVSAEEFNENDIVNMFETFHGFVSNGDKNMPNGWKTANYNSDKTHRVIGESDAETGSNIMRMFDWCTNIYKFSETIRTGNLHISFDMKVDAPSFANSTGTTLSAAHISGFNASVNDDTDDYYNSTRTFQVYSNFMRFNAYSDGTMKLLIPKSAHNGITSGEYLAEQNYIPSWNKYDIFVNFTDGRTKIYSNGSLMATQPLGPDYTNIYDSLKAFSFCASRENNIYVDNVYMHHYQTADEFEAPKIAIDYANATVASKNGTVDVVFSESVNVDTFTAGQFIIKNSLTGEIAAIEDVTPIDGTTGARITFSSLEPGEYAVSVKDSVKGAISDKAVLNVAAFAVAGSKADEIRRYYINENFDSYKGGMPLDFGAAQYGSYDANYASSLTSVKGADGTAIKLGANKNIEYKFGEPIYSGKFTVEFDVNRSNGGWAVGLMSAGDFFYDDDYMEISQYEQRENDITYSIWKKGHDDGTIADDWSTWAKDKSQKFIEWQTQNEARWLGEKINHYTTRKSKNLLVGNTNADNASAVYTAKGKSATGTDLLDGITIAENTWTHVKTVVDLDAGTYSFYVNGSTTPVVVSYTQPTTANKSYRLARFARDEFYNSTNSAIAPKKFIYGIQGIRLQSIADTKYDNVMVYTGTLYNDSLDFNGKVSGTAQPGWSFSEGGQNYAYNAHRPEARMHTALGASGSENDKAIHFNAMNDNDYYDRYFIHNFATPVKAGASFEIDFDVKSSNTAIQRTADGWSRWLFGLVEEDYIQQTALNTAEGSVAANGELGNKAANDDFKYRCFIGNNVAGYDYGKIGVNTNGGDILHTNMDVDTGLVEETNEWNHIKLLVTPNDNGASLVASITNKDGETTASNTINLTGESANRFNEKDTYGCVFYGINFMIDNFKVKQLESKPKTANAVLAKSLTSNGFDNVAVGEVDWQVDTVKDGREAWLLDNSRGTDASSINFVLSNDIKHTQKDGSVYDIEVDYYDSGNGYLRLYYDSYTNEKRTAETVYTNKENKWKTLKVTLDDAAFTGRCDGMYDFSVAITAQSISTPVSPESIAISEVRVKRYEAKNPIFVTSTNDETGNAFKWFSESKIIHNNFENLTDEKQNVTVTYTAISDSYVKVFEKAENYTFEPREERNIDVDLGNVTQCGIYKWYVDVKSSDRKINSHTQPFEFSIIKTDPNGIKNDTYFAAHLDRYPEEQRQMGAEMIKNANASGMRSGWSWEYFERQPGVFSSATMAEAKVLNNLLERNLHYIAYFSATNTKYGMIDYRDYPDTPEELEAFREFVKNAAIEVNGKVDGIEIFNEPNISGFNRHVEQGLDYAAKIYVDCLKVAYEEIKKVNPDLKVGGPVLCFINNEKGKDFFTAAMNYGMWQYLDALDLHPYANNYVEKTGLKEHIEWYKQEFEKVGKNEIEFWYSEMGYTTADKGIDTPERQGYLNTASVMFYKSKNVGDKFVFYNLEQKGTVKTDREDNFGHTSPGYVESSVYGKWFVPRPSYLIVTAMNYFMAQTQTVESYYVDNDNISVNLFESNKFNKKLLTLYSINEHKNITLDLGTDNIVFADEYGNETEMSSQNGIYTFAVDKAPVYILGNITTAQVLNTQCGALISGYDVSVAANDNYTIELTAQDNNDYTVEIDAPECVKGLNVSEFNNGKANITFKNTAKPGENYKINVYLTAGGNKVQYSGINIKSIEPVKVTPTVNLISKKNLNRWQIAFDIKNYMHKQDATGKIRIVSPNDLQTDYIDIGQIPSGDTRQVKINLPSIYKKNEYSISYELLLDNGSVINSSEKFDFTLAKYASDKPIIDGVANDGEWTYDTFMYAENDYQVNQITDWNGVDDLSAKACVEWDENNMYFMCEVTDDIFNQPETENAEHNGDCVHIGIFYGDEVQVAMGQKNATYHELCLSKTADSAAVYRLLSQDDCYEAGDITGDCEIAVVNDGSKTVYELKIPWEKLLMPNQSPVVNDKLGFSFFVNENDGSGRRGRIEFTSGMGENKNTQLFVYPTLIN